MFGEQLCFQSAEHPPCLELMNNELGKHGVVLTCMQVQAACVHH
jgi:hypothetical protein